MTIEEAIEIKCRQREGYTTYSPETIDEADKLGIEALKRLKAMRSSDMVSPDRKLLGETEK